MKRYISFLIILVLALTSNLAVAEHESIVKEIGEVKAGEEIEVEYPIQIEEENIMTPEGFEYVGYSGGKHIFKALKDMNDVTVQFYYHETETEIEQDKGEGENQGDVGTGGGSGGATWDGYKLGKLFWQDSPNNQIIYTIRLDAKDFIKGKEVIVRDIPSKPIEMKVEPYVVGYNVPEQGGAIESPTTIESQIYQDTKDYEIVFQAEDFDIYEINYTIYWEKEIKNGYIALQGDKVIVSGGEITGNQPEHKPAPETEHTPKPEPEQAPEPSPVVPEPQPEPSPPLLVPEYLPEPELPIPEPIIPEEEPQEETPEIIIEKENEEVEEDDSIEELTSKEVDTKEEERSIEKDKQEISKTNDIIVGEKLPKTGEKHYWAIMLVLGIALVVLGVKINR